MAQRIFKHFDIGHGVTTGNLDGSLNIIRDSPYLNRHVVAVQVDDYVTGSVISIKRETYTPGVDDGKSHGWSDKGVMHMSKQYKF